MSTLLSVQVSDLSFRVESPFSLCVKATESNNKDDDITMVYVPKGYQLRISTATVEHVIIPFLKTFCSNSPPTRILIFSPVHLQLQRWVGAHLYGLGLDVCGKWSVIFQAAGNGGISLCVCGFLMGDKSIEN